MMFVATGTRLTRKAFPTTKRTLVAAVALLALGTFTALIPASEAKNAEHSYLAGSTSDQSGTAAPFSSGPTAAAPRMSEEEAIDAYEELPLAFVANESQSTNEAMRYYAQGAGYGFFFSSKGATLSFAEGKGRGGHALGLDFLGADPDATLTAKSGLRGRSTTW